MVPLISNIPEAFDIPSTYQGRTRKVSDDDGNVDPMKMQDTPRVGRSAAQPGTFARSVCCLFRTKLSGRRTIRRGPSLFSVTGAPASRKTSAACQLIAI